MSEITLEKIKNMSLKEQIETLKTIDEKSFLDLFKNITLIINSDDAFLRVLFLNAKDEIKEIIINNPVLLKRILEIKEHNKKTVYDFLNLNLKEMILKQKHIIDQVSEKLFFDYIAKLKDNELEIVSKKLSPNLIFFSDESIKHYLVGKYNLNKKTTKEKDKVINKFLNNKHATYFLFRIDNFEKLYIYSKFDLLLNITTHNKKIIFEDGSSIDFNLLVDLNAKHLNLLIANMKKEDPTSKDYQLLINAIKLYSIFGYDNAKKILDNKFTYMTDKALDRTLDDLITDERRQYRIENQSKFFTNKMIAKVLDYDVSYIQDLLECDINYANEVIEKIKENKDSVVKIIQKEITKRESRIKKNLINKAKDLELKKEFKRGPLTTSEIYKLLYNVEVKKILINENGQAVVDELLQKFLLGNGKVDNDCLLRRVFNNYAYGLNNTIDVVVNNFEKLKDIVINSNGKLSLFSLLDVVDISKVMIFNIPPNETDLTLESVTKILNSRTYVDLEKEKILINARKLHLERRKKYYSSIPFVSKEEQDYKYEIVKSDDPSLITSGIDVNSCLKVGGPGEDLLRYCLTNPNGAILRIYDKNKKMYLTPVMRNGNTLFINGIDPEIKSREESEFVMDVLKKSIEEIVSKTNNEKIELVVMTNLNQKKYMNESNYKKTDIDEIVGIDKIMYTDFDNKSKYDRFLLKEEPGSKFKSYFPKEIFYLNRNNNYFYCIDSEEDLERINLIVNSINYDSINYLNIDEQKKDLLKVNYEPINLLDTEYVVGNKDWFIALFKDNTFVSKLLPYDPRAKEEYKKELEEFKNKYKGVSK